MASAEQFNIVYGERPKEINILLPFDDIDAVWDIWLEAYTASRLIARSDGEQIIYMASPVELAEQGVKIIPSLGKETVRDGQPYVPCPSDNVIGTYYSTKKNKDFELKLEPAGRLRVVIPELERLAYLVAHTGSWNDASMNAAGPRLTVASTRADFTCPSATDKTKW